MGMPDNEYKGNWVEDYNGGDNQYVSKCIDCGKYFFGDKHRYICKLCHDIRIDNIINQSKQKGKE